MALKEDKEDKEEMKHSYHEEGNSRPRVGGKPESEGKRTEHRHCYNNQKEYDGECCECQQAHQFINHIQFQVFRLNTQIVFDNLRQLRDGLYVLVA